MSLGNEGEDEMTPPDSPKQQQHLIKSKGLLLRMEIEKPNRPLIDTKLACLDGEKSSRVKATK